MYACIEIFIFSDDSDDPSGLLVRLPRRLLNGKGQIRQRRKGPAKKLEPVNHYDSEEEELASKYVAEWTDKDHGRLGSNIPAFVEPPLTYDPAMFDTLSSAYDYYKLFQPDTWAREVIHQSQLYGVHKHHLKNCTDIDLDLYRCFEGMLLQSGYHQVPRRKMQWEDKPDCWNKLVAESIRREEVDLILKCLHFRDNKDIDNDGFYKVRPIFDNLNRNGSKFFAGQCKYSVDEGIIPYFGRHSAKQFIKGKPIRYGFKVWALCTPCGSGVWFEAYNGAHTRIKDVGLGYGNVVVGLAKKANLGPGCELFFDNLFTSFPLLERLSQLQIAGTGTVNANKLNKVPIMSKKEMKKPRVPRGTLQKLFQKDQCLVAWKDNNAVYAASNKYTADCDSTCRRFFKSTRQYNQVRTKRILYVMLTCSVNVTLSSKKIIIVCIFSRSPYQG